ncbi:putative Subtilisin-like serine protease 2 [Hibiscus syriacus]|uniref:Subtilisin-like serine protease 2 n=1 Tax=Hibiscus syriacus TaxID=106335 RepID=A0A6A2WUS9_HIBSY|nr:putative Subtilisin-like serine protease 2 [Hibiscus syriacus]
MHHNNARPLPALSSNQGRVDALEKVTPSQVSEIKKSPAHTAVHEEKSGKLFTTHSPQFMGLTHSSGLWNASSYGEGVIIGVIDTVVWPESESFNEKGMPPIPTRWKGKCQTSTINPFPCNRKLIGAQVFFKGSQAAGESDSSDDSPRDFDGHGSHTSSTAAGNHVAGASQFGYANGVARGIAPSAHVATYKVSTGELNVESDILAAMDQAIADGVDVMSLSLGFKQTPYFQDVIAIASLSVVVFCDNKDSTGIFEQAEELARVNAAAGILISDWTLTDIGYLSLPSQILPPSSGAMIKKYTTEATDDASAKIMRLLRTSFGTKPAPKVADFSLRGPDPINPSILKPDIIAPGVNVLAAFPPTIPVQQFGNYELASDYALLSGTLFSTPHVAGVTVLLKAVHPEWSPAAIHSALMTTAYTIDNNGTTLTIQASKHSGTPLDYGAGYNDTEMKTILRQSQWKCSQEGTDLNYPSFVAMFSASSSNVKNFTRIVTKVGDEQSVYQAIVETTHGMTIREEPTTLTFTNKYQKQKYAVSIQMDGKAPPVAYGYLKCYGTGRSYS